MRYTPRPDCQIPGLADIYEQHLPPGPGTFVEVGAHDGVRVSNTVFLAEAGWKGLYIEAHPDFCTLCIANHSNNPGIQVMHTAIGAHVGTVDFYEIGECSTMIWDKNAIDWGGNKDRKIQVPVTTLNLAMEKAECKPGFDLLVIDVEQAELLVLSGFDPIRWKPHLVIIEAHEKDSASERNFKAFAINSYFHQHGYTKIYADHINSIFVRCA